MRGRGSSARGLRVRLGERRGDEGLASGVGEGESERLPAGCMMVGREWARVIGGALSALEVLWERRWVREKGERLRGWKWKAASVSEEGSVCARGVVGRRDEMLSSEVLLSSRARVLPSPIMSVSPRGVSASRGAGVEGAVAAVD